MPKTCYYCSAPATSREHVPAQCFFPELKDLSAGKNYRKNLITVPSCDLHNSEKSEDDMYLMMVIISYFKNNKAAQNQINSKVMRAFENDKKMVTTLVKKMHQFHSAGELQHAYEIDIERFNRSLELAAHGLHFNAFKMKPANPYVAISYPIQKIDGLCANEVNISRTKILVLADQILSGIPLIGQNQEIFWFQLTSEISGWHVLKMCFYQAFTVVLLSSPTMRLGK